MKQGSEEWHAWRESGIGASEIAAVLGLSPWKTPYQLWLDKTGQAERFSGNAATRRGQELEEEALDALEEHLGGLVLKRHECFKHPEEPLLASLDARLNKVIYDIKCPGEKQYEAMKAGIPDYYEAQLQQQALVVEANGVDIIGMYLWVYHPDNGGYLLETKPSDEWRERIVTAARRFWARVETYCWPEDNLATLVYELAAAKRAEAEAIEARKAIEERLVNAMRNEHKKRVDLEDGYRATLTVRRVVDREACSKIPEWVELTAKEKEIAATRKEIEKQHTKEGAATIRLTEPK